MSFDYNNTIRFENGIQHTFSEDEIYILKCLLDEAKDVGEVLLQSFKSTIK